MRVGKLRLAAALIGISLLCANASGAELAPRQRAIHVLNRLAFGPRPGDVERVTQMGVDRYIDEQLHPERIPLPADLAQRIDALDAIHRSNGELIREFRDAAQEAKQNPEQGKQARRQLVVAVAEQTAAERLALALRSPRQLEEVMVDFWFNHFNVFEGKGLDRMLVESYEREAIRPFALGRFRDLLGATAKHPAMLFYLDNWQSAAPGFTPPFHFGNKQGPSGLNENYARELMELHTLGVDGGYTQRDVTELARMLTGWTFDPRTGEYRFVERRHDQDEKFWLGHRIKSNGEREGEYALDELARAPATAHHIAYELAQYFVADDPPASLIDTLATRFTRTDGDIRSVLDTLFHSAEFWNADAYGKKFKTPYRYVLSAVRASDVELPNYRPLLGTLKQLGMPLYGCQTPDGYKNTEAAWLNPDALSRRINFATALAAGRLPFAKGDDAKKETSVPIDAARLTETLNVQLSEPTLRAVDAADPRLRAAMMLGSPDFMRY